MIFVKTDHPIAISSNDHLVPWGTARDNHTSLGLIQELSEYFNTMRFSQSISLLDIGCSGGQFVADALNEGHLAVGLEGSDYSLKNGRCNWPRLAGKNLFTCDAVQPWEILQDCPITGAVSPIRFDCISAWEVLEHFSLDELPRFFSNISKHTHSQSIFIGTVSLVHDAPLGVEYHKTVMPKEQWYDLFASCGFQVMNYPFANAVRCEPTSFSVLCKKL